MIPRILLLYSLQVTPATPASPDIMYSVLPVVMVALAVGILSNIGALIRMMRKTVGALEVYRGYSLGDTSCVELDDCFVDIVVRKVDGVCAE